MFPKLKVHIRLWGELKFIYSEKATKICEIFPILLTAVQTVKSKGKILQNFVAFSEYMNFRQNYPLEFKSGYGSSGGSDKCFRLKNSMWEWFHWHISSSVGPVSFFKQQLSKS